LVLWRRRAGVALDPVDGDGRTPMRRVTQRCVGATHESTHSCDGGDAFPAMESGRAAERRVHHRSQGARAPGACGLARRDGSHGATPWRFSSARRVAPFGRARRWDWHVNRGAGHASTPKQCDTIPMDQNLGELPSSCARMQKMRNEPNDIVCNQWLSVSSIALARVAGGRAAPERSLPGQWVRLRKTSR
jgi:hypothetical protein